MKKNSGIIIPQKQLTQAETHKLYAATIDALKNMSIRCQMACCALYLENPKHDIFKMNEGIFDKRHLFEVKKSVLNGEYDRNRLIARKAFNS